VRADIAGTADNEDVGQEYMSKPIKGTLFYATRPLEGLRTIAASPIT
jgi:hypothetical protein